MSALTLHPRHAERQTDDRWDERKEKDREERRRRSYESSPSEDPKKREYMHYSGGKGRRGSVVEGVPSERNRRADERMRRRGDGTREDFAPKW